MSAQLRPCLPWPLLYSLMGFFFLLFSVNFEKGLAFSDPFSKHFPALCCSAQPLLQEALLKHLMCPILGCPSSPVEFFQLFFCNVFILLWWGSTHCIQTQIHASVPEDIFYTTLNLIQSRAQGKQLMSSVKATKLEQNKMNVGYHAAFISWKVFTGTGLKCNLN